MTSHQYDRRKSDRPITMRVGSGSSMCTDSNMLRKTGMTKISSTATATSATVKMTAG